jgi:hypothetical protein
VEWSSILDGDNIAEQVCLKLPDGRELWFSALMLTRTLRGLGVGGLG